MLYIQADRHSFLTSYKNVIYEDACFWLYYIYENVIRAMKCLHKLCKLYLTTSDLTKVVFVFDMIGPTTG